MLSVMSENQPTTASTPYEEGHITIDGLNIGLLQERLAFVLSGELRHKPLDDHLHRSAWQLGATPFTVMGWSEGGRTAIHVAGQGGKNLVPRMILVSTGSRKLDILGMKNTDHWLPNAKAPYLEHCTYDFLKVQWAALCDVVQQVHDFCGGRFPSDYVLPKLECKSLILNGGMDRFCGDPKKDFVPVLKHCKVDIHAQGGHDFYLKYPKWFCARVQDFIRTNLP
ncbi:hypothetical protein WR25_15340 [Diploscapter pachys]|uniref:AB hydrolase-1 domain-containing protein n=1 Tax=Diploscapter pachys TaxID=2018661 RepID=A0A2A2KLF2_9BILA|nr:hypothetical protein WR25_15340 [Diploscapter pachys]